VVCHPQVGGPQEGTLVDGPGPQAKPRRCDRRS
jgi:hypothetical protein